MRTIVVSLTILLLLPGVLAAKTFEDVAVVGLSAGVVLPGGDGAAAWDPGPFGKVNLRFPLTPNISVGLESGIESPEAEVSDLTLLQFPVRMLLFFPLAPEASASPYVAGGAGAVINRIESDVQGFEGTETDTYFSYAVELGYALRPEKFRHTIFNLATRYEQQVIGDDPDWRGIQLSLGVGYRFLLGASAP